MRARSHKGFSVSPFASLDRHLPPIVFLLPTRQPPVSFSRCPSRSRDAAILDEVAVGFDEIINQGRVMSAHEGSRGWGTFVNPSATGSNKKNAPRFSKCLRSVSRYIRITDKLNTTISNSVGFVPRVVVSLMLRACQDEGASGYGDAVFKITQTLSDQGARNVAAADSYRARI